MNQYYCEKCDTVSINASQSLTVTADCSTCKTKTSQRLLSYKGKPDPTKVESKPISGAFYFDANAFQAATPKGPVKAADIIAAQAKHDKENSTPAVAVPTTADIQKVEKSVVEATVKQQTVKLDVASGGVR